MSGAAERRPGRRPLPRVGALLLALAVLFPTPGAAAEPEQRITIGESNDQAQTAALLEAFGADPGAPYETVTVAETEALTGDVFDLTGVDTAYSSTALACRPAGAGLDVETRNIEVVTPGLYAMALVTAGIDDAALVVAAPDDAPALGMTALAGVFATWDAAPCRGGALSPARRRLALEQIAVTAAIGQADDSPDGMARATRLVLATQQAVVTQDLAQPAALVGVIDREAAATGLDLAPEQRTDLLDLMLRLGDPDLDWQTYAGGWTVADAGADRIALRGLTAVAAPPPLGPGGVGGGAARVASRAATPSALPVASPPATPRASPVAIATPATPVAAASSSPLRPVVGTVLGTAGDALTVRETGSEAPTTYALAAGAPVRRDGAAASFSAVAPNDGVWLLVDDAAGAAVALVADPAVPAAPAAAVRSPARWLWLAALAPILAAVVLFSRRRVFPVRAAEPAATPIASGRRVLAVRQWLSRPTAGGGRIWRTKG